MVVVYSHRAQTWEGGLTVVDEGVVRRRERCDSRVRRRFVVIVGLAIVVRMRERSSAVVSR